MSTKRVEWLYESDMPKYCRRVDLGFGEELLEVRALKVVRVIHSGLAVEPLLGLMFEEPYLTKPITRVWVATWQPEPGGYYVIHDSLGGISSFESAEQFESCYRPQGEAPPMSTMHVCVYTPCTCQNTGG